MKSKNPPDPPKGLRSIKGSKGLVTRRPTESDSHLIILNDPKYVSTRVDSVFLELARDSVSTPLNNERAERNEQPAPNRTGG